jgi:hypothetical protein
VEQWDTLPNISKYLEKFTNNFSSGCMSYRHIRFFRAVKDGHVWVHGTSKMSSFGNTEDYWRGLDGKSTHTIAFTTSFGIPDLFKAAQTRQIPAAAKRYVPPKEVELQEVSLRLIHKHCTKFDEESVADCLAICKLQSHRAKQFCLPIIELQRLFGKGPGQGASAQLQMQHALRLPVAEIGATYLVRPEKGEKDVFLVGIPRRRLRAKGEHGVNMQWFSAVNTAEPYKSLWKPDNDISTRSS